MTHADMWPLKMTNTCFAVKQIIKKNRRVAKINTNKQIGAQNFNIPWNAHTRNTNAKNHI